MIETASTGMAETMTHVLTGVDQKHHLQTLNDVAATAIIITTIAIMNTPEVGISATIRVVLVLGPLTNATMRSGSSSKSNRRYVWRSATTL